MQEALLLEIYPPGPERIEIDSLEFCLNTAELSEAEINKEEVLNAIESQKSLMIAVSTGGPRIQSVNSQYKSISQSIRESLAEIGLKDPNPYNDMWEWYGKWSGGDLPTYQSRRQYIAELYTQLIDYLKREDDSGRCAVLFEEPTGWAKVDRQLGEVRKQLEKAETEEYFQTVGLLCRETIITLAQTVYVPDVHLSSDNTIPSETDAKRMLDAYISHELSGHGNEEARAHAKAAYKLSAALQHKRTADFRQAALCAEATTSIINLIAIISGRRDPQ